MPTVAVDGTRLYYEERGSGAAILGVHGCSSSAMVWEKAAATLAGLGRVIIYDRRGCTRSERPRPYERVSVARHADDAAALLDGLGAASAVVIGRSYGGEVATDLAFASLPEELRAMFTGNGPAILAELSGEWLRPDPAAIAAIEQPVLLVGAADSRPEFREPNDAMAAMLPDARTVVVEGGHLIDPAAPPVLAFIEEVLAGRP